MLVALLYSQRVEASRTLHRGLDFKCPGCAAPLILRAGEVRIAHFAHRPGAVCAWDRGETIEHRESKKHLRDVFAARGLRTELEYVVDCLPGDRRVDVMVWSPSGRMVAVEVQHTSISELEIRTRASAYSRANISQIWVPLLRESTWDAAKADETGGWVVERYTPRPFEPWLHEHATLWFYHRRRRLLWRGLLSPCPLWQNPSEWYGEDGEEMSAGGYFQTSRRWVKLRLVGPFSPEDVRLTNGSRSRWGFATFVAPPPQQKVS